MRWAPEKAGEANDTLGALGAGQMGMPPHCDSTGPHAVGSQATGDKIAMFRAR